MALLEEISGFSRKAARLLEETDIRTDQDIRSLSRNDLQELLPGLSNFRLRKKIYEVINEKHPIRAVLSELKSYTPDELLRDAFNSNGGLQDSVLMLKALKSEVYRVHEFLDAQIDLLEKFSGREDTSTNKSQALVIKHVPPASSSATNTNTFEQNCYQQKAEAPPFTPDYLNHFSMFQATQPIIQATVTYKVCVSGNTLDRHLDILAKLNRKDLHLQEAKPDENSQLTIVFCPVVSRAGTDVETALNCISGDEQVILVIMHHNRSVFSPQVGQVSRNNVVLTVHVFFHETVPGLLQCLQNDEAINKIRTKLRSFSTEAGKPFH